MAAIVLEVTRDTDLPAEVVWPVIADLDGYAQHVSSLSSTTVIDGSGGGARRRCTDARGRDWEETCVLWEDGRRYVIEVDVATYPADLRALFRSFTGTWELTPRRDGSTMRLRFEGDVRGGRVGAAVVERMAAGARRDLERTLASYERAARGRIAA
jgi:hypothetical protein